MICQPCMLRLRSTVLSEAALEFAGDIGIAAAMSIVKGSTLVELMKDLQPVDEEYVEQFCNQCMFQCYLRF